ncbi:MAG TPA: alpha/beta hydrolase domain-containing protein, partial [Gemmataceae bacterium]|nr:alpha/beta hydrolase domain-containing protein [Gemmataceae bacterium]
MAVVRPARGSESSFPERSDRMIGSEFVRGMLVLVAALGALVATAVAADEKDAVGAWKLKYDPGNGDHEATLTVTQEKSGLKGKFVDGDRKFDVPKIEYKDGKLTFITRTERDGEKATATFEGKMKGDAIEGEASWEYQGMSGSFPFTGKREAEKPRADAPSAVAVPGKPSLALGSYEVEPLGYQVEEFFVSGTASSYKLKGEARADGKWDAVPARTSPYTTRVVVVRPTDPAKFSGTAVVEWLNVTGGFDMPVEWNMTHREILRRGHAYVGVSAQKVGVEGGRGATRPELAPLKKADPKRYGRLSHPGDAFAYDIFSQAGRLVMDAAASKILGPLAPRRVIAVGESQSAFFLVTYVTAVDPLARVYDGFLIHSRFGPAAPLDDTPALDALVRPAKGVKLRPDLRVPVMTVVAENDVLGWPPLKGSHAARQADTDRLRVWEVAGTAHADNYVYAAGYIDSGSLPLEKLAAAYAPTKDALGGKLAEPMNFGPQHHYVVQAALWQLDRWVRTGQAPPKAPPLKLTEGKTPKLITDANGLAEGGLRTPWVDVPTARLSGVGNSGSPQAGMVGVGKPFDAATLDRLYPGGKGEYLKRFEASLDTAIKAGFIVPEDKAEIMGLAALGFSRKAEASAAPPPASAKTVAEAGKKVIPIWPDRAPGSEDWMQKELEYRNDWDKKTMVRNVTTPTLTAFLPDPSLATGAAVVICPGGGFRFLSWQSEGTEVAQWLQARGVAAFVLKYRLMKTAASEEEFRKEMAAFFVSLANRRDRPSADNAPKREATKDQEKPSEASRRDIPEDMRRIGAFAIADGKQAIKVVRRHAAEWGIKPDRVGIMGFSAGGMVTMDVVMDSDKESRPDFAAPIYGGGGTGGAKIPADAPPLFILCASDDFLADGSARLYAEWKGAGRPVELHIYEKGGHGFGMTPKGLPVDRWIERYGDWLGACKESCVRNPVWVYPST